MAKKFRRISVKPLKRKYVPGDTPGHLEVSADALEPRIYVYSFNAEHYRVIQINNYRELKLLLEQAPGFTHWVDIRGLKDLSLFQWVEENYHVNLLVLEDILVNTFQRPKLEEYDTYCFTVSRMLYLDKELRMENEQVSFILTKNILFTFQENYTDCLDPVRNRLKVGKGIIRTAGASYVMYALMDVILDNYFALLDRLGEQLDMLEDRLYHNPDKHIMFEIQQVKRMFSGIRRAVWPERDKLNDMLRSSSPLITSETKLYIRDAYDHAVQIIDLVENYKEISTSLIDIYLSVTSNRMNEIMKVLTIISAVFIPLTFIAGIYGMNFAHQDPETGKILYKNMPELYAENGYIYTLGVMLLIGIVQLIFFWRRGWLK